jgi:hypothetical protein
MRQKYPNIIILLILIFLFSSCANFTKKGFRKNLEKLKPESITRLDGTYALRPARRYYSLENLYPKGYRPDSSRFANAYEFLLNKGDQFPYLDSMKNDLTLKLRLEGATNLDVQVLENSIILEQATLEGTYKNGMFYLDNKFLKCHGIPFILGGCENTKRRIGLTKEGNLLINEALSNEGAFLIMFGAGYKYNTTYEYKRM